MNANPFDSELFDHIAYAYRTAPGHKPDLVVAAFEALQDFCKGALVTAVLQGFEPFEYTERS